MESLLQELTPVVKSSGDRSAKADFYEVKVSYGLRRSQFCPPPETIQDARAYVEVSQEMDDAVRLVDAHSTLCLALFFGNQLEESLKRLTVNLERAREIGDSNAIVFCLAYLSLIARRRALAEETEELVSELLRCKPSPEYLGLAKGHKAWIAWRSGRLRQAIRLGNEALRYWKTVPYPVQWSGLLPLLASLSKEPEGSRNMQEKKLVELLLDPRQQKLPSALGKRLRHHDVKGAIREAQTLKFL